jgi:hypothetical protein
VKEEEEEEVNRYAVTSVVALGWLGGSLDSD